VNSYNSKEYKTSNAHRFHVRHRAAKKISLLFLVLGILCVLISVIMLAFSFVGTPSSRHIRRVISLCYVGAGFGMLATRYVMEFLLDRRPSRRYSSNYQPRLRNALHSAKEPLPLNGKAAEDSTLNKNRSGAVLVMVLILLALIVGLVVETQISARSCLRRRQLNLLETRLQQAAADAAWGVLRKLANDEDLSVDHTNEVWAAPEEARDPSGVLTRVKIADQDRCFNLNNLAIAPPPANARPAADIVMDIMTLCGDFAPVSRVDSLKDWIDSDDEGFAEQAFYREKTPPYEAANRPLYALSELLWANGFNRTYFARRERHGALDVFSSEIVDCLAVLPDQHHSMTPINVNTAGKETLLGVLGVTRDSLVQRIMARRNERPIRSLDQFFAETGQPMPVELRPYLDVKSRFFAVDAQANTEGHTEHLQVLARRGDGGNVDILQWVY
jgi:type II secretory pathway component PulK